MKEFRRRVIAATVSAIAMAPLAAVAQKAADRTVMAPGTAATPIGSARLAVAREVVDLVVPTAQREQMFETALNSFMANMLAGMFAGDAKLQASLDAIPQAKGVLATFIERQRKLALADLQRTMPELLGAYVNAFARNFTLAQLEELRAFFTSPTGQVYAARSSKLLTDPDFAAWQRHVSQLAAARKDRELRTLMEDLAPILRAHKDQSNGS